MEDKDEGEKRAAVNLEDRTKVVLESELEGLKDATTMSGLKS